MIEQDENGVRILQRIDIMETPKYIHDCTECEFLGRFESDGIIYDLYYHEKQLIGGETVIARFSSFGPDYISGLRFAKPYTDLITGEEMVNEPLSEALRRHNQKKEATQAGVRDNG